MKKLALVITAAILMVFSVVSVSAEDNVVSPVAPTQPATKATTPASSTSPKTGTSSNEILIFAGLSVVACAGVAVVAKKRISE